MGTDAETRQLTDKLLAFMAGGGFDLTPRPPSLKWKGVQSRPLDDARFNALALEVFAYQYERNAAYRAFCQRRGATLANVRRWPAVPAVPAAAFKELPIACFPVERAAVVYRSSGTMGQKRSQHYLPSLELYEASLKPAFKAFVLPDVSNIRMLALAPPPRLMPQSSLIHMLEVALRTWGAPGSAYCLDEAGLQHKAVVAALREAERSGEPIALLGAAFAFVHLLDYCREQGLRFALPPGSRIMDTGGYKGRSREAPKQELYALYGSVLGVPLHHVVNEYGMTELGSQFYDTVLRDAQSITTKTQRTQRVQKLSPPPRSSPVEEEVTGDRVRYKQGPPWARAVVVDPETLEPTGPSSSLPAAPSPHRGGGRREGVGLLRIYDLANLGSAMAIQTDDLGVYAGEGFEILGRASGAEARGCSIAMDELLSGSAHPEHVEG